MASKVIDLPEYIRSKSVESTDGCIVWMGKRNWWGRAVFPESVRLRFGVSVFVARHLLSLKEKPPPEGRCLHSCDNPACVNILHLRWGTQRENLEEMTVKGRRASGKILSLPGEKNPRAKLTQSVVEFIRGSGLKGRELAKMFNLRESQVSNIRRYKSWKGEAHA